MEALSIGLIALAGLVIGLITVSKGNGWGYALAAMSVIAGLIAIA